MKTHNTLVNTTGYYYIYESFNPFGPKFLFYLQLAKLYYF